MEANPQKLINRKSFVRTSTGLMTGFAFFPLSSVANNDYFADEINIIGPRAGYSAQLGTFVSMMDWMRASVIRAVDGLTQAELDFLLDPESNTIGALLMHLAATEVVYQDLTLYSLKEFSDSNKQKWGVAMGLGDEGRKQIKGNNLDYYLSALKEVREKTLTEFKKRDDKWLAEVDPSFFGNKPTNNYCKWFHVCEHEANHRGQITVIKKRLPGRKAGND
jgi:uncharacterized damage-inducible protein DinB